MGMTEQSRLQAAAFCLLFSISYVAVAGMEQSAQSPPRFRAAQLFSDPAGDILPASAVITLNKPINGEIATTNVRGGQQPAVKTVSINKGLLLEGPRRLALDMPGNVNVVITRRSDVSGGTTAGTPQASEVTPSSGTNSTATNSTGTASVWVGEVVGYKGALSSAVLVTAENGGVYGRIHFVNRNGKQRTFTISPLTLGGADATAAAGAPADVDVASLYPNIDTTRHVVMEVIEPNYAKLHAEQIARNGGLTMTRQAALQAEWAAQNSSGVATVATIAPGESTGNASVNGAAPFPTDAQSLAEAMAASAGPDVSKNPADYLAVATAYVTGAAAPTTPAALPATAAVSPTDSTTPGTGRKLLQGSATQDILMVYTSAAASRSGGVATIENNIRIAAAGTNKAYADSGVSLKLNIVAIRQVTYTERDATGGSVLDDITNGRIPNVQSWRDQFGADLVQIWSMSQCGVAWGYNLGDQISDRWLYSQVGDQCWGAPTMAHEIGHNQGCGHNPSGFGSGGGNIATYAFGFRRCDLGNRNFMTIMSYPCDQNTWPPQIMLFSNPSRTYNSVPAGNANNGHCARTLGETARTIEAIRKPVATPSGTIRPGNLNPKKCLDAPSYTAGTRVHLWDCHNGANQQWQYMADGSLKIPGTNSCLDVRQGGTADGTPVQVWDCNGTPAQLWFYDAQRRLHPYAAPHKCLDLASGNTANGAQIQLWDCQTGNNNQIWTTTVPSLTTFTPQNNGLRSALNNLVLDVSRVDFTNGNRIHMWSWLGANNQRWQLDARGALRSTHNTNKCIDASNTGNGAAVYIFDCHTGANQRWFQDRLGRLRPYHVSNKCLDIAGANTAQGTFVQLWDCLDVPQQKWSAI